MKEGRELYRKIKPKTNIWKTYIIPLIVTIIAFLIGGYLIINAINTFLYRQMVDDAIRQANIHSSRLSNSITASGITEGILDEKLFISNNMVINNKEKLSDEYLKKISKELKVDEINWFNSNGEIIYSNINYSGFKIKKDHPAYKFMKSNDNSFIEEVRKDTESDRNYKYGYRKDENGEFVQTGILADNIYEITREFCPRKYIDKLIDKENILDAHIIDLPESLYFCDDEIDNQYILSKEEKDDIKENQIHFSKTNYDGEEAYKIILPINIDEEKIGNLAIFYSLENTNNLIRKITIISIYIILFLFLIYEIMAIIIGRKNRKIIEVAYFDPITNLQNKNYFIQFLNEKIIKNKKEKQGLILVNCGNLDLIKLISNQELLDSLIRKKADILRELDIKEEYLFRYSEENFLIYIENYKDKKELIKRAEEIVEELNKLVECKDCSRLVVNCSKQVIKRIGILEIDEKYEKSSKVLQHLDITINEIQKLEDKSYWFFNEEMVEELIYDERVEQELRKSVHDGFDKEFYLEYQPQIDVKTNKVVGLEALARWNNKKLGLIPPNKFIEIAEEFHLIIPLGEWIIENACKFIKKLEYKGFDNIKVAVNISPIQLLQKNFIRDLMKLIKDVGIKPQSLELEITETNFMDNYKVINRRLDSLRECGVSVSLDDFGTGYSSLTRLKDFNIDGLKIDKSFIDNLDNKEKKDILVNMIILLGKELDLQVIAEGVETEPQKEYLISENCDTMQGYLFSKPISEKETIKLLEENKEE